MTFVKPTMPFVHSLKSHYYLLQFSGTIPHCPLCHKACPPWATMKTPLLPKTTSWMKGGFLKGKIAPDGRVELTWTQQMTVTLMIFKLLPHFCPVRVIHWLAWTWRKCCLKATVDKTLRHQFEFLKSGSRNVAAELSLPRCSNDMQIRL